MNKILGFTKGLNRKAVHVNKNLTARFVGIHCHVDCLLMKYRKLRAETHAFQADVLKKMCSKFLHVQLTPEVFL